MIDVVAAAERLLAAAPATTKVASAPELTPSEDGAPEFVVLMRKFAHAVRTEGLTVEPITVDEVLRGTFQTKIASDEEPRAGSAVSLSPIAAEARALAAGLRKFAADQRRAQAASLEREIELAVLAEHEKLASEYYTGHMPVGAGQNPQTTGSSGVMPFLAGAGVGVGGVLAAPHLIAALKGPIPEPPLPPATDAEAAQQALIRAGKLTADTAGDALHSGGNFLQGIFGGQ